MIVAACVPVLCALVYGVVSPWLAGRAPPKAGPRLMAAVALTLAVAADAGLGVLVGARLLDAAPLAAVLGWRSERPGPIPVPAAISMLAAAALTLIAVGAWRDWRRWHGATRWVRALRPGVAGVELVVIASPRPLAHAVPGARGRHGHIVVSDGMLAALAADERRVLLAHERTHLRHRHERYRRFARASMRVNPMLRPVVPSVDFLLERWADEEAAREVGSRVTAARALARAALIATPGEGEPVAAAFADHQVLRRVDALLGAGPRRAEAAVAAALGVVVALIAIAAATDAVHMLGHLFDLLRGDG